MICGTENAVHANTPCLLGATATTIAAYDLRTCN